LKSTLDVNWRDAQEGETVLHHASLLGHQVIVHRLLRHPLINVNAQDTLLPGCELGAGTEAEALLADKRVDINLPEHSDFFFFSFLFFPCRFTVAFCSAVDLTLAEIQHTPIALHHSAVASLLVRDLFFSFLLFSFLFFFFFFFFSFLFLQENSFSEQTKHDRVADTLIQIKVLQLFCCI